MDGAIYGPIASVWFSLDKNGIIIGEPRTALLDYRGDDDDRAKTIVAICHSMLAPALLAMTFMHCKNVLTVDNHPDKNINRERKKCGLRPFIKYQTIDIQPMTKLLKTEGQLETNGIKKAFHICNGHFATLTRNNKGEELEKPTTYYRERHIRGSAKEGVVVSDYRVSPPKNPNP